MNAHGLRVLEFERIRQRVLEHALSEEAAELVAREGFRHSASEIASYHRISSLIRRCRHTTIEKPAFSFPPVADAVARVKKDGVVLEAEELAAIRTYAYSAAVAKRYYTESLGQLEDPGDELRALLDAIPEIPKLVSRISRVIDQDGSIKEREIPELREIRGQITKAEQELAQTARQILTRDDTRRYWNSTVPTQREGRVVLALKSEHKGKVRGIVHEVSSTGATVFVEPDSVVELNNRVTEAHHRYHAELLKIMRDLSAACRAELPQLNASLGAVTEFDRHHMRARYADQIAAESPQVGGKRFSLRQARHPLLKEPVPIELVFPPGKRLLIITGPNTGGKTVSLKTAGLLALMNQFGLELPVAPDSEVPVFDDVFADIGDEQSLEQNLSTFSGHMQNIAAILNSAGKRSLVLLDELGSGTDPQEGGALARAILDELVDRRPFTVVTTHHGVLKHYGYTRPTAGNASVEFDPTSLRPTYHIVPGVPGASHAVEIAAGQGIPNPIITAADGYLTGEEQDVASIIRRLTTEEQRLRERETELESTMEQLQQQRAQLEESATDLDRRERELRAAKLREFDQFSAEARRRLENLVRELRETEITRKRTGEVKEFISGLDEYAGTQRANLSARLSARATTSPRNPDATANAAEPQIGDRVEILSTRKTGTVQRAGKGNTWIIQAGALKLPVPAGDLRVLEPARPQRGPEVEYSGGGGAHAPLELDLRGKRLAEAVDEVDRQIDAALLSGLSQFSIIHGTGGGVLQTGVRDLLASNPHVASFAYAHPEQGGFGKTVVTLSGA